MKIHFVYGVKAWGKACGLSMCFQQGRTGHSEGCSITNLLLWDRNLDLHFLLTFKNPSKPQKCLHALFQSHYFVQEKSFSYVLISVKTDINLLWVKPDSVSSLDE